MLFKEKTREPVNMPVLVFFSFSLEALLGLVGLEALAAEYGAIASGLEGHLSGLAAAITNHVVHRTIGTAGGAILLTAGGAARGATAGLILEALVGVELLLRSGENEFLAALTANQSLVFKHGYNPP